MIIDHWITGPLFEGFKELKESQCLCVCPSVCLAQVCLKHSIVIFVAKFYLRSLSGLFYQVKVIQVSLRSLLFYFKGQTEHQILRLFIRVQYINLALY